MPRIDLHAHTTASDGLLRPPELVEHAAARRLDVVAVTDHDTVAGVAEATRAGEQLSVRVVAGIELSTARQGRNVHVLGYFLDIDASMLRDALDGMRAERVDRAKRMVDRLNELGYALTFDEVMAQSAGGVIARPHVARALVARGYVPDVGSAFTPELIGDSGRAQVPRRLPDPLEGVALVRASGGVAVVAHPGTLHHDGDPVSLDEELISELRDAGLGGIEVDHPDHDDAARARWAAVADRLGLVPTGGSDFHGHGGRLGTCTTTPEAFERLESVAAR